MSWMIWTTMTADERLNVKPYQFAQAKTFYRYAVGYPFGGRYATPINKRCAI